MITTFEEAKYEFKKVSSQIRRRFKDIEFGFKLDQPNPNRVIKLEFYKACYLAHLRKKNKHVKIDTDKYQAFVNFARGEYKKAVLYSRVRIQATLKPSHRLCINKEMGSGYMYNALFVNGTVNTSQFKLESPIVTNLIIEHLNSYKRRSIEQKKIWLESSYQSSLSERRYKEALDELSNSGSIKPDSRDASRYVGVEIECASKLSFEDMKELIAKKAPSLSKSLRLGEDGSIRTEEGFTYPIEFRLLMKESDKERVLTLFQKVIGPYIKVNDSCGLHVHLDMRNRNYVRSFERLVDTTPILMSMVPKSRRENNYCVINKDKKEHSKAGRNGVGRYRVINPESFGKYKTLEVRVHSATKNATKIINWINLLTLVIDKEFSDNRAGKRIAEPKRRITNLISFFTKYEVPASLRNYITMRIAKFGRFKELKVPMELETIIPAVTTEVTTSQDEAS